MAAVAGAAGGAGPPPPPGGGNNGPPGGGPIVPAGVQFNGLTEQEELEIALTESFEVLGGAIKGKAGKRAVFVNVMRKTYRPGYLMPVEHRRRWARHFKVERKVIDRWLADFLRETGRYRTVGSRKLPRVNTVKAVDSELARATIKVEPKVAKSLQELERASHNAVRSLVQSGNTRRQRDRRRTEDDVNNFIAANYLRTMNKKNNGTAFNGKINSRHRDGEDP